MKNYLVLLKEISLFVLKAASIITSIILGVFLVAFIMTNIGYYFTSKLGLVLGWICLMVVMIILFIFVITTVIYVKEYKK